MNFTISFKLELGLTFYLFVIEYALGIDFQT